MNELHVVALSGGKDSTAMAHRLNEVEPRKYVYVLTPTGNETDAMFDHWRKLKADLGGEFIPLVSNTLVGLIEKQNALPNWRQRWCTRILKIEPFARWLSVQSEKYDLVTCYVGLRADEPEREGGDYSEVPNVTMRYPMREWGWGINEVLIYLDKKGIVIPERTDCKLCFFQRLNEWYKFWSNDPDGWAEGERLEALTGYTFRSDGRDSWPASMRDLRTEFENGRRPRGTQYDLFASTQCRVCRM